MIVTTIKLIIAKMKILMIMIANNLYLIRIYVVPQTGLFFSNYLTTSKAKPLTIFAKKTPS